MPRIFWTTLRFILCAMALWPVCVAGQTRAEAVISGSANHLFPALLDLDYPYCRARAWLNALHEAQKKLPDTLRAEFGVQISDISMGGDAVASLLYPVETTTPDISLGNTIQVFLQSSSPTTFTSLHEAVPLQILLLLEINELLNLTEKNWPENLRDADEKRRDLETLAQTLSGLWLIKSGQRPEPEILAKALQLAPRSLLLAYWDALATQEADMPQKTLEKATEVEQRALIQARANPKTAAPLKYLASRALLLRGKAHAQLGQHALAENAFTEAMSNLKESGYDENFRADILLARAELRKTRHDFTGMCQDYLGACAAGQCAPLALARRNGHCETGSQP